ncbi:MAG: ATP-dependent zinc metalloprotease FtsH [Clostridia bacterium]|nr:ATP-dependent zinc metalloprotease FtsH [Clostridia bacterium]
MNKKTKTIIWIVVTVVALGIIAFLIADFINAAREIDFTHFRQLILEGKINKVYVDGYKWTGILADASGKAVNGSEKYTAFGPSIYDYQSYYLLFADGGVLVGLKPNQIAVEFADPNAGNIWSSLLPIVGVVLVALMFFFIMRSAASGGGNPSMSLGKNKTQVQNNLKVRFSDVAGAEEEKEELQEVVEFLKSPKKFATLGARIPSGVLLVGPPGTGKTLFAKAVAGEAGVPFFSVSGSDFVEMYVGVGAKRVRDLFDMAKKSQPCIIFIDEIDAVGRRRGAGLGGGHDEREQTLNQILVQMDGFESNDGIIVMAATNRADILDPALLRPGRFDRQINVNLPDVKGREQILKVHARNKPMAADVNFKTVARITAGFSGAELANLLNEAAILAARNGKKTIGNLELYDGINKVLMGPQKKSHVVTESDKRCTAYHESGHAILACLCKHCDPVHEVSIIPRGRAAGYTMTRPETDDKDISYNKLIDKICMTLGGRVAEELVIKDVMTGASQDLQVVSDLARTMVTQWGMSEKLGLVAYDSDQPVFMGMEYGNQSRISYSQETAAAIDDEVRRLISEAHERATALLKENRAILDNMSRVLVEKETIYTEEVALLMKGASYKEVIEYMEKDGDEHEKNPFIRMTAPSAEHIVSDNAEEKETFKVVESVEIKGDVDEMDVEIAEIVDEPNAANETEEAENKDEE